MATATHDDRPATIMVIDDHPLLRRGVRQLLEIEDDLDLVFDTGSPAEGVEQATALEPDMLLLDLNMPRKDGKEVLADINEEDGLSRIPVVVLTSSESEEDIAKSYELSANAYLTKPVDFDGFVEIVNRLEDFWFQVVKLPED